jgi:hypothetical protein
MTALNASDYGMIAITPNRLVDFSAGPAMIQFEMSTERQSLRDWPDLWVTPWEDNLTLPFGEGDVDLQGPPRRGVHVSAHSSQSSWQVYTISNSVEKEVRGCGLCSMQSGIAAGTNQAATRQTFRLTISSTHLRMERLESPTASQLTFADLAIPDLGFTTGVVQFAHHSYTPTKDGAGVPATWHWDNFTISPSIPFQIIHTPKRTLQGSSGSVTFTSPAPSNSWLRFTAIGTVEYSVNGGTTWVSASKQRFQGHVEHKSSYFLRIPEDVQTVQLRFSPDTWYKGPYIAQDFAIWVEPSVP